MGDQIANRNSFSHDGKSQTYHARDQFTQFPVFSDNSQRASSRAPSHDRSHSPISPEQTRASIASANEHPPGVFELSSDPAPQELDTRRRTPPPDSPASDYSWSRNPHAPVPIELDSDPKLSHQTQSHINGNAKAGIWHKTLAWSNDPSRKYWVRSVVTLLVAGAIAAIVIGSLKGTGNLSNDDEPKPVAPPNIEVMPNSGVCAIDLNDGSSRVNFFYQNGAGGLEEWLFDGKDWKK